MSKIIKLLFIALFTGLMSALFSSTFLHLLSLVTNIRTSNPWLIWGLPFFGLLLALVIKRMPYQVNQGVPWILQQLDDEKGRVSFWMAPFMLITSLGTHLFGGSAGREGVGVIMGAAASNILPSLRRSFLTMKPFLIYSGVAAGFSSIFGTPLTAVVFAFELLKFKDLKRIDQLWVTGISAFVAFRVPEYLGIRHPKFSISFDPNPDLLFYVLIGGISSGIGAQLFYWGMKHYGKLITRLVPDLNSKLFFGGLLVSCLVFMTDGYAYIGIGGEMIERAFHSPMGISDFLMKCLLTIMTLSVGFKGGEVTPLFFMGSTLANGVSSLFHLSNYGLSAALGMCALFGAVTATPLASTILAIELFGPKVGALCFFSCIIARFLMGNKSVYRYGQN